jgi:uncharacterized membrane protein YfcA
MGGDRPAVVGWHSWWNALATFGAGMLAGVVNSVAGGGTNISFPVLLWLGLPPITANATSATALWPGVMSAAAGFAPEIRKSPKRWYWLAIPSLVGGAIGAYLLVHTPSTVFGSIAPWLVIGSIILMAAEPLLVKRFTVLQGERRGTRWMALALGVQLAISAYGGYFGAGLGILILAALGLLGLRDMHTANGTKNVYSVAIKGVAVIYFVVMSRVVWHAAITMAVGAVAGGYLGARVGRRLKQSTMRWVAVGIGVAIGLVMLVKTV